MDSCVCYLRAWLGNAIVLRVPDVASLDWRCIAGVNIIQSELQITQRATHQDLVVLKSNGLNPRHRCQLIEALQTS